jgi:hypothetical protein
MLNEKQIKESANVNPSSSKETFLPYYKELWTNNSFEENCCNAGNADDHWRNTRGMEE